VASAAPAHRVSTYVGALCGPACLCLCVPVGAAPSITRHPRPNIPAYVSPARVPRIQAFDRVLLDCGLANYCSVGPADEPECGSCAKSAVDRCLKLRQHQPLVGGAWRPLAATATHPARRHPSGVRKNKLCLLRVFDAMQCRAASIQRVPGTCRELRRRPPRCLCRRMSHTSPSHPFPRGSCGARVEARPAGFEAAASLTGRTCSSRKTRSPQPPARCERQPTTLLAS
jgi:hypothetical protein